MSVTLPTSNETPAARPPQEPVTRADYLEARKGYRRENSLTPITSLPSIPGLKKTAIAYMTKSMPSSKIAERMGVGIDFVERLLSEEMASSFVEKSTEEYRSLQLGKLDMVFNAILPDVQVGNTKAVDKALKIIEFQNDLLGLSKTEGPVIQQNYVMYGPPKSDDVEIWAKGTGGVYEVEAETVEEFDGSDSPSLVRK